MKIQLQKIGDGAGIVLPVELLGRLKLKQGDWLFATELADGRLVLSPSDPSFETGMDLARKAIRRYQMALRMTAFAQCLANTSVAPSFLISRTS
jgi:antitoxin component of MazEF toxin-antitoxin module